MQINRTLRSLALASCMAASLPTAVYAGQEDVQAVNQMIEDLPDMDNMSTITTLTPEEIEKVKQARDAYIALDMSEKVQVTDYAKLSGLYDRLLSNGSIKDEVLESQQKEDYSRQQQDEQEVSANSDKALKYVFELSSTDGTSRTVILHYTTDINGDGVWDKPERIVLTNPKGESTPVTEAVTAMKDDNMNIVLTWEPNFLQLDIASGITGKWTITTSSEVTFTSSNYLGLQDMIPAQDDTEESAEETQGEDVGYGKDDVMPTEEATETETAEPIPESGSSGPGLIKSILGIGAIIAMLGALLFMYKKMKATGGAEDEEPEEKPEPLSEDEEMDRFKQEYKAEEKKQLEQFSQDEDMSPLEEDEDDDDEVNTIVSQPDIEDDDETIEAHMEGDTDLLRRNDEADRSLRQNRRKRGSRFES